MEFFKTISEHPLYIKYKAFLLPAATILISLNLFILIVIPQIFNGFATSKLIDQNETKFTSLEKKIAILEGVDVVKYQQDIGKALVSIPTDKDIPGVIGQVLYLVSKSKLKLSSMSVTPAGSSENGLETFSVTITVEGGVSELKDLINNTKKSPRAITVNGLEVSGSRGLTVQAVISFLTYYQDLITNLGELEQEIQGVNPEELKILATISDNIKQVPTITDASVSGPKGKSNPFE